MTDALTLHKISADATIPRLAWLTGKSERAIRADLEELRRLGVLVTIDGVNYFNPAALPKRRAR